MQKTAVQPARSVQAAATERSSSTRSGGIALAPPAYGIDFADQGQQAVQRSASVGVPSPSPAKILAAARRGTGGAGVALPHLGQIQRSFGHHDARSIAAHVDWHAATAAREMGARAFALGHHVAFADSTDLHTAAHEAAHVIQQRGGVRLKDRVGQSGDRYERHADAVADLVVQGRSAEALLDQHVGPRGGASTATHDQVQMVRVRDSRDLAETDTDVLLAEQGPQGLVALALTFFSLHNMGELAKIQEHHQAQLMQLGYNISDDALEMMSRPVSSKQVKDSKSEPKIEPKAKVKVKTKAIDIRQGLIHGSYEPDTNSVDLHVDAKGGGGGIDPQDMYDVAVECHRYMIACEKQGGPQGKFMLHPTGAAIVKIMVELLGEALGGWWATKQAELLQFHRKQFGTPSKKNPDKLTADVLPEHFAFLDAVRGTGRTSIIPRVMALDKAKYGNTEQNVNQDMMATDKLGNAQYQRYKSVLLDPDEPYGPGLDVTVDSNQLAAIIELLRSRLPKKKK